MPAVVPGGPGVAAARAGSGPGLPYVTYLTVDPAERPLRCRLGVSAGPTCQNPC